MKTLTLNIPDTLDLDEKEAKTSMAANLYQMGKLSIGQAAELAGYSKRAFMEIIGNYGVSIFNYSESDLENDILNAKAHRL
jgi:predicted HTH domain antitoxin